MFESCPSKSKMIPNSATCKCRGCRAMGHGWNNFKVPKTNLNQIQFILSIPQFDIDFRSRWMEKIGVPKTWHILSGFAIMEREAIGAIGSLQKDQHFVGLLDDLLHSDPLDDLCTQRHPVSAPSYEYWFSGVPTLDESKSPFGNDVFLDPHLQWTLGEKDMSHLQYLSISDI